MNLRKLKKLELMELDYFFIETFILKQNFSKEENEFFEILLDTVPYSKDRFNKLKNWLIYKNIDFYDFKDNKENLELKDKILEVVDSYKEKILEFYPTIFIGFISLDLLNNK